MNHIQKLAEFVHTRPEVFLSRSRSLDISGSWYIPAGIPTKIAWIIGARDRPGKPALGTLRDFLDDLATGQYTVALPQLVEWRSGLIALRGAGRPHEVRCAHQCDC